MFAPHLYLANVYASCLLRQGFPVNSACLAGAVCRSDSKVRPPDPCYDKTIFVLAKTNLSVGGH